MHDDLISAIYDGPLADRPWAAALPKLRRLTGAHRLMLKFTPINGGGCSAIYTDSACPENDRDPDRPTEAYRRIYQWKDPVYYGGIPGGEVRQLEALIDRQTFRASDYYRELCRPLDIEHAYFAFVGRYGGTDVWLNGSRGGDTGPFSAREMASVRQFLPHLSRAVLMQRRLRQLEDQSAIYAHGVSALAVGVVMLDHQGEILEINAEAEAILAGQSSVRRLGRRLCLSGSAQQEFADALRQLRSAPTPAAHAIAGQDGLSPVSLIIRSAEGLAGQKSGSEIAFVVYLKRDAQSLPATAADYVSDHFGLTKAEARLAILLTNGHSIGEAASLLGVTVTTARTYCKRALTKTGTTRQTELVRLLLGSLASLA